MPRQCVPCGSKKPPKDQTAAKQQTRPDAARATYRETLKKIVAENQQTGAPIADRR